MSAGVSQGNNEEEEEGTHDQGNEEFDGGREITSRLVSEYIKMWPRAIFHNQSESPSKRGNAHLLAREFVVLNQPGVYILYRDDRPFYVGQARNLRSRLRTHANTMNSFKGYFWNYFSAFVVRDVGYIDEVEAIVIAAMPAVLTNSSKPSLPPHPMEPALRKLMRERRRGGLF